MGDITRHKLALWVLLCLASRVSGFAQGNSQIQLDRIAQGISQCTDIQSPRDGSGRLFFVQQNGLIRIWRDGALLAGNFLDLRGRISTGGERGLLGLAFPPLFGERKYFYINYTNPAGSTVVSRIRISASSDNQADLSTEQILLTVNQPFSNHNGGQLQFGPDGLLYIGLGDGGSANDPQNHGQNPRSLLGKMLRLQVEPNLARYEVPPDNPFANNPNYAPEVWALGLRNPWRYAFDRETGDLYIADVGQNAFEEIDFQPAASRGGENYGWVTMEGRVCVRSGCNTQGLTLPVHVYPRSEGLSITGGYVYRGQRYANLRGAYVYGDYVTGRVWALRRQGDQWTNVLLIDLGRGFSISTFGEDEDGELLVANHSNGEIFRIRGSSPAPQLSGAGVVNAATFRAGLVPGSLATAFSAGVLLADQIILASRVPLPTILENVRLRINNFDAPLLALVRNASGEQINFQVPWELTPGAAATVEVIANGVSSNAVDVALARLSPGVFSRDNISALVIDAESFAVASDPIDRARTYVLYATGLGPLRDRISSGEAFSGAIPLSGSASLNIGGVPAAISFAGAAPGFPGVYQINFRAGAGTPPGQQDLVLSVDSVASPSRKVTVAP
jgi:uncharacterized protein (TIGR03437 family)